MSRRIRALLVAIAISTPLLVVATPAHATCIPGSVTLSPKPSVQLPKCDPPPQ